MVTVATPPAPPAASRRLLTSEEFLDWLEPGVHADLIGGEILMHSPVNLRHSTLLNFVDRLLGLYLEQKDLGASSMAGFWVKRAWLNPDSPPPVAKCLGEILAARKVRSTARR